MRVRTNFPIDNAKDLRAFPPLVHHYHVKIGESAWPLMHKLQYTSIDKWVRAPKTIPIYAVLSGFEPTFTPSVGTFYDFFPTVMRHSISSSVEVEKEKVKKTKERKKEKTSKTETRACAAATKDSLWSKAARSTPNRSFLSCSCIHLLLKDCYLFASSLTVLLSKQVDVRTGNFFATIGSKKTENAHANDYFRIPIPTIAEAVLEKPTIIDKIYSWLVPLIVRTIYLTIYPRLYQASKHDNVLWVSTFHELLHWYPDWKIGESIIRYRLRCFTHYEMLEQYDVSAIIDLNLRCSKKLTHKEMVINPNGIPICPIGRPMDTVGNNIVQLPSRNGNVPSLFRLGLWTNLLYIHESEFPPISPRPTWRQECSIGGILFVQGESVVSNVKK